LHGELFPICICFFQYLFMIPTYINTFQIYSFCNMHDISWGTKGLESAGHEKVEDKEVSGGDTITSGDTVQNEANRIHDLVMKERKKRLTKGEADDKDDVEREFRWVLCVV
jgi:chitin synthase